MTINSIGDLPSGRVLKHSVSIRGHRTSFSLEAAFADELKRLAKLQDLSLAELVAAIDAARPNDASLSAALRIYVLEELKQERNMAYSTAVTPPSS